MNEVESWEESSSVGVPYALSKLIPTAETSCSLDSGMDACPDSRSGMTCPPLTASHGADTLTLSAGDFHVRTSPQRVRVQDLPEHVRAWSMRCSESLMRCGLRLCSRKTVRTFAPRDWQPSSRDLSAWGMWDESGYWELGTSVRRTSASGCGSLPTPTVHGDYNRKGASEHSGDGLVTMLRRLLALTTRDRDWPSQLRRNQPGFILALKTLPTPTASLYDNDQGGGAGRTGKIRPSLESLTGGVYLALREWMRSDSPNADEHSGRPDNDS